MKYSDNIIRRLNKEKAQALSERDEAQAELDKAAKKKVKLDEIESIEVKESVFGKKATLAKEDYDTLSDTAKKYVAMVKSAKKLKAEHPRDGKTVYIGSTWRDFETEKDGKFAIRMVYEITERTTSADGQEMLFPETEIDMYWTCL